MNVFEGEDLLGFEDNLRLDLAADDFAEETVVHCRTVAGQLFLAPIMKRILVGLDGSPRSDGVLTLAIGLAERYAAQLVLFRAIGVPSEMPPKVWQDDSGSLEDRLQHSAHDYLEAISARVPERLLGGHRTVVEIGSPWQAICSAATHEEADLIVIGSHGYGAVDRVLGSTAAKVVNHAHCSVYVVREKA